MATFDSTVDLSSTNPFPRGTAQVLCHGTDITLHVPATGIHLNGLQARALALALHAAADCARDNFAGTIGL